MSKKESYTFGEEIVRKYKPRSGAEIYAHYNKFMQDNVQDVIDLYGGPEEEEQFIRLISSPMNDAQAIQWLKNNPV